MSEEKKSLTIGDFKNQVGRIVKALSELNSSDRVEAFSYLQNCVRNLDPFKESNFSLVDNGNENQIAEGSNGDESFRNSDYELKYNDYNLSDATEKECLKSVKDLECESNCFCCGDQFSNVKELYFHGLKEHPGDAISCKNCDISFKNSQLYQIHLVLQKCNRKDRNSGNLICSYCDKEYQNFQHYSLHIQGHKRNKCEECGVHFNSRKNLKEHFLDKHKKELQKDFFECKFCDRKYSQKRSLLKHYKLMHNKDNIICLKCGEVFKTVIDLKSHEQMHVNNTFSCDSCGEKFSRRQQYLVHLKEHNKYQCVTCKTSCANKMKLEKHERAGHIIKGLPTEHQCSICGNSFHFQSSLFFHKKLHSVSSEDFYGCEPCKKMFKNYQSYREHLLTEQHFSSANLADATNLIVCKFCNKVFPHKRRLVKHLNRCHQKVKKIFKCDICDFKSQIELCLKKHMKLHTKKREIICEKCGDSFYTKNALVGHINYVHNEERNFNCEKCGQTFKSASVLNRHMLCHSKVPTYECHCGQSYKFAGNLTRHQALVHGKTAKSKRVKRLITDEVVNQTSKSNKNKMKHEFKEKQKPNNNNTATIYTIIDAQGVQLPFEQILNQGSLLLSGSQSDTQMLQVACNGLNFISDNRTQLVLPQNLHVASLHEVDTILQSEDSLKTTDTSETTESTPRNIFGQHLSDTDGSTLLDTESLIHPPIEPSLVTSFEDSSLNSIDQLGTNPDQTNSQVQLQSLTGEPYYNINFLDM